MFETYFCARPKSQTRRSVSISLRRAVRFPATRTHNIRRKGRREIRRKKRSSERRINVVRPFVVVAAYLWYTRAIYTVRVSSSSSPSQKSDNKLANPIIRVLYCFPRGELAMSICHLVTRRRVTSYNNIPSYTAC